MEIIYISRAEATVPLDPEVLLTLVDFNMTWCESTAFHSMLASDGFWVGESRPVDVDGEIGAIFPVYRLVDGYKQKDQIGYMVTTREEREDQIS